MLFKTTMLFNEGKQGWSESWYLDVSDARIAMDRLEQLSVSRRGLMGVTAHIEGLRVSVLDSPSSTYLKTYDEASGTDLDFPDYPSATIVAAITTGELYRRVTFLRGFPDGKVKMSAHKDGTMFIDLVMESRFTTYVSALRQLNFKYKVTDKAGFAGKGFRIDNVGSEGVRIKLTVDTPDFVPGDRIKIKRMTSTFKEEVKKLNRTWLVLSAVGSDIVINAAASDFPNRADYTGGWGWRLTYTYVIPDAGYLVRTGARRAGRAFFVPAGRRPRRR